MARFRNASAGSTATCREPRWPYSAVGANRKTGASRRSVELAGALLSAYEAEFAGRLLIAADDVARWRAEPADGLCWGSLGVAGFDFLIREPADLDHLPDLFERGVRVFQLAATRTICWPERPKPTTTAASPISACAFLAGLGALSGDNPSGSMPIVDLAGLNSRSITGILDWCEHQSTPGGRPLLMFSHGEITHPISARVRGLTRDQIVRLRALGGVVGLTPSRSSYQTPDELKAVIEEIASIPFEGRSGHEGIAIGTDFLACEKRCPAWPTLPKSRHGLARTLDGDAAPLLLAGNASRLLVRAAGVPPGAGPPR